MRSAPPLWPALGLSVLLALGACATRPDPSDREAVAEYEQNNDPLEPANRVSYDVHDAIDRYALEPAARGYRAAIPAP
ncbi:MAG TPA: MlaA family lipoprotein, partial [Roseomonas sp.]